MRRDLLRTNSVEKSFHVVHVTEDKRIFIAVIRMNVSLLHVLDVLLIVSLTVLSLILWLLPKFNNY